MIDFVVQTGRRTRLIATGEDARRAIRLFTNWGGLKRHPGKKASFPCHSRMFELMLRNGSKATPRVLEWYQKQLAPEIQAMALLDKGDAKFEHPSFDKLKPFQRAGARFVSWAGRTLLCDDMGLGKTVQAIVATELSRWHDRVLVICPKSLQTLWVHEKAKWTAHPQVPVTVLESKTMKEQLCDFESGWLIAHPWQVRKDLVNANADTFESSRPRYKWREGVTLGSIYWDWIIVDEGHRFLANRKTITFNAVKRLKRRRIVILTGTPYGNNPAEIWTLLNLIEPKRYTSYWRFFELYVDYFEDDYVGRKITGIRNADLLRRELAPRMAMRKKADVGINLPSKDHQEIPLTMEEKQLRLYVKMAREGLITLETPEDADEDAEETTITADTTLAVMTRLRQIVSTPATLGFADNSIKLDAAMDIIQGTKEGVVVFAMFRATVEALYERLTRIGIPALCLMGGVQTEDLAKAEKGLLNGTIRVVIGTISFAGIGLNLNGASIVIFVDKHFNPNWQHQAEDRVHRIGQTKDVLVLALYCPGTIDDLVNAILERKISMQEPILRQRLIEELDGFITRYGYITNTPMSTPISRAQVKAAKAAKAY